MTDQPKQTWRHEWRIEAPRTGWKTRVFLNDEDFGRYLSRMTLDIPAGGRTHMTLTLAPRYVEIVTDPELHLIVGDRRFRVIEETEGEGGLDDGLFGARRSNGDAHQSL